MFNHYTGCNHAWTSILSDVKRVGLDYDKSKRACYNGMSLRGVIVGIKKKTQEVEDDKTSFIDPDGLDYGLDSNSELERVKSQRDEYRQQVEELKQQLEELKAQLKQQAKPAKSLLDEALEDAEEGELKYEPKNKSIKKMLNSINL
jgi:predicted RNase H-like nuclease (RuvC/YqgF family)